MEPVTSEDAWDFYPCRIDEEAASIFLNLRYERDQPPATATTLYRVRLPMREPARNSAAATAKPAPNSSRLNTGSANGPASTFASAMAAPPATSGEASSRALRNRVLRQSRSLPRRSTSFHTLEFGRLRPPTAMPRASSVRLKR
jgi:hypothetical protein